MSTFLGNIPNEIFGHPCEEHSREVDSDGAIMEHCDDETHIVYPDGEQRWLKDGELHRDNDLPAVIIGDNKEWHQHGELHRDGDKPAVIGEDGNEEWYQHGELHRDGDKPAIIDEDGNKHWYQHGERHRDGDRPALIFSHGDQEWYQNGKEYARLRFEKVVESIPTLRTLVRKEGMNRELFGESLKKTLPKEHFTHNMINFLYNYVKNSSHLIQEEQFLERFKEVDA